MKIIAFQSRDNRGAAMIGLCLALFTVLSILGFFVYDMNRMQMAQRQLTAICDAAALSGSAMLSAQDVSYEDSTEDTLYSAQYTAEQYAENMFCMGAILGTRLYDYRVTGITGFMVSGPQSSVAALSSVPANQIYTYISLVDPSTGYSSYQAGNSQGRAFLVQASYGYTPSLSAVGVGGPLIIRAQSTAATQVMNVVMVFDCSGSMDDNTRVTFVDRIWDNSQNKYSYVTASTSGLTSGSNRLCDYTGLDYGNAPNGTALNVLPPQNLWNLGYLYSGTYNIWANSTTYFDNAHPPLAFDLSMRSYVATPTTSYPFASGGATGTFTGPWYDNDFGTPPGNCPLKYGTKQSLSIWSTGGSGYSSCWDGNVNHGWGPLGVTPAGFAGYLNGATGSNDGNCYFYDPNAMPAAYSGATYAPFTDLVVNIVNPSFPLTQPLEGGTTPYPSAPATSNASGSSPSSGVTFPSGSFTVFFAEGGGGNSSYAYEYDSQLQGLNFQFPNLAYLVEASRGNLDPDNNGNATNYINALLSLGSDQYGTIPQNAVTAGYQKAYQRMAMYVSQPFATAQSGAFKFFQNLAQTSAAYFGLVGFSSSPANNTGFPDTCAYLNNGGTPTSLFYACTGSPSSASPSQADFFGHGLMAASPPSSNNYLSINPNVWIWSPTAASAGADGPAGPAATPTGIPYSATYNANGPGNSGASSTAPTWVNINFGSASGTPAATSSISWAFTNLGFQIPRCFLTGASSDTAGGNIQQTTFNGVCSNETESIYSTAGDSTTASSSGCNGLFHCRPLGDTDAMEALETGLANLGVSTYSGMTGYQTPASNQRAGAINVLVFFTDGVPTNGNTIYVDFTDFQSNIAAPAQTSGIPIYSIGLALNDNVKANQSAFLTTLTNNGANGSQFFQVISSGSLTAAFTGIAKQLTQCIR